MILVLFYVWVGENGFFKWLIYDISDNRKDMRKVVFDDGDGNLVVFWSFIVRYVYKYLKIFE